MYSAVAPKYIYESEVLDKIRDSKFFLTIRDDSWYNLRGGSDPYLHGSISKTFRKIISKDFMLVPTDTPGAENI
jgi:hypothetical protein